MNDQSFVLSGKVLEFVDALLRTLNGAELTDTTISLATSSNRSGMGFGG